MAPSTLGTFLRAFTFGHVRQLDHVLDQSLARAWEAGAGPGDGALVIDVESFIGEVHGEQKQGADYRYTRQLGYHPIAAVRADTGEVLHNRNRNRNRKGNANASVVSPGSSMSWSRASAAPAITARSSSVPTRDSRTTS